MVRTRALIGGIAMLLAVAVTCQAQEERRRGGGQGRGGFGGPGMFGGSASGAFLLGSPEVQKELEVTDEQKGLIEDMVADLREQMRSSFSGFQGFQQLSEDERRARMEEAQKKGEEINKKTDEMIKMILEPKQQERLEQLRLQTEGVRAFRRDDVAAKLGLTDEQKEKIQSVERESGESMRGLFSPNASEDERREAFTKMQEARRKAEEQILGALTPEQKEKWEQMLGKKFDFPRPTFGRGGEGPRRREAPKKDE